MTADDAKDAGPLHAELLARHDVGLTAAFIRSSARRRRMRLISDDHALRGLADVRAA